MPLDTPLQGNEHRERPVYMSSERQPWTSSERQLTSSSRDLMDILREQLQAAQERERDYREHIARLTTMLDQAHQQNQRLLDMPRQAPQEAPDAAQPPRRVHTPPARPDTPPRPPGDVRAARGDMRRRIVALLRDYPAGLTLREMQERLGVERSLTDTVLAMRRDGWLRRIGRGRYGVGCQRRPETACKWSG